MMNATALLRNRWFLTGFLLCYVGLLWVLFLDIYKPDILIYKLYRGEQQADQQTIMQLYQDLMSAEPTERNMISYIRLAEVLARQGRPSEASNMWNLLAAMEPKNSGLRLRLAMALHNAGKYAEADDHFAKLLKESG